MKRARSLFLGVTFAATALIDLEATVAIELLHAIPSPHMTPQSGARFGSSAAIDGAYAVVGAPYDDVSAPDGGVVKVFDSATGALVYELFNPSPATGDRFGNAVAISGTRVVVGASADDAGTIDAGSAYVYDLAGATPTVPIVTLQNPAPGADDSFGNAVAISGLRVVVAAFSDNTGGEDAGSFYAYDLGSPTPTVPALTLNNPDPNPGDRFGSSIAISGSMVLVGAPYDDSFAQNSGMVYVYDLSRTTLVLPVGMLGHPGAGARFGQSVGISGSLVLAGEIGNAYLYDINSATPTVGTKLQLPIGLGFGAFGEGAFGEQVAISGPRGLVGGSASHAYVYDLSTGLPTLTLRGGSVSLAISGTRALMGAGDAPAGPPYADVGSAQLFDLGGATPTVAIPIQNNPGPAPSDLFGNSVAISGNRVVVGAPLVDKLPGFVDAGSVYVYDLSRGTAASAAPAFTLNDPVGPTGNDQFGISVGISGLRVLVGAWGRSQGNGSAFLYNLGSGTPTVPEVELMNPGPGNPWDNFQDGFGSSVAISDALAVVGAPSDNTGGADAGSAYVYTLATVGTSTMATLDNPSPQAGDQFGASVAASGRRVVVSAPNDNTGAAQAGSVYIYDLNSGTPTVPVATLNNPTPANQDHFGQSVAISGTRVVVGAPSDDTGAAQAGSAYVYDLGSPTPTVPVVTLNNPAGAAHDVFGGSVAIAGTRVVVGAIGADAGALDAGKIYVFELSDANPTAPVSQLNNPTPAASDIFGFSVAADGSTIAVGTPWEDTRGRDNGSAYVYGFKSPEIGVEVQPSQDSVVDGGSHSFGEVFDKGAANRTFTIRNTGLLPLAGLALTLDGPDAADFAITSGPTATVIAPNDSTSFTVLFAPNSVGEKAARLHIASNDEDENPFDINLSGSYLQPAVRLVNQGQPTSFSVTVPGPATYQWRKDGVDISGAVGSTLTIPSVQPWQIGVYSVRVTAGAGSTVNDATLLALTDVPSGVWRGLVACYPFDGSPEDLCRIGKPVNFVSTSGLVTDAQRGGIAHVQGKGWAVPPFPGEPVEVQGPGGYLQIPRPPLVDGEPFTVSFVIKEEGFSLQHGESLFTMGEGAHSNDLLAHYWIGSFEGLQEIYAGPTQTVQDYNSDYVWDGAAITVNSPWTGYTLVGDGNILHVHRDGQLIGTSAYTNGTLGDSFMGRHWWENGARYSTRLVAKVDEVRIYNRALTTPEVGQLFSQTQSTPPAGSFESWVLIHGLNGADATPDADADHDGHTNWEEFCFGTSPTDGTGSPLKATMTGTTLRIEWLERDGVVYVLKESSNLLSPWTASAETPVAAADQSGAPAGYQRMQVVIAVPPPATAAANRFLRVEGIKAP